jgi:hypothetical protein
MQNNATVAVASVGFVSGADRKILIRRFASNIDIWHSQRSPWDSKYWLEASDGTGASKVSRLRACSFQNP